MEYIANKINKYGEDIINDNDFLLVAFDFIDFEQKQLDDDQEIKKYFENCTHI